MFARNSSVPSSISSLLCLVTVVALSAFGTGCASTSSTSGDALLGIPGASTSSHDSRLAHFDRESVDHRIF